MTEHPGAPTSDLNRFDSFGPSVSVSKEGLQEFDTDQMASVGGAVEMSEDLVSNAYKMSGDEWRRLNYDIKTLSDLSSHELIIGPYAQIIRYKAQYKNTSLTTRSFDHYKICIQDHNVIQTMKRKNGLGFFPFMLYIVTHELIHVVRFCKFLQSFDASEEEREEEEKRVHGKTRSVLSNIRMEGLEGVLEYYRFSSS